MAFAKHFFVDSMGDLFDTRRPNWEYEPLRRRVVYCGLVCENTRDLRAAIRAKHVWPGGYEIFGLTPDAAAICHDCLRKEYRLISQAVRDKDSDGWRVVAFDHTGNLDEHAECDNCYEHLGGAE